MFMTLPKSCHDQSDHRTSNHVHSKALKHSRAYISSNASLKPEQEKVFSEFLGGKDVFVFLPTGCGKSLVTLRYSWPLISRGLVP